MKNGLQCGFVYAGAVIGAGFASGKELWQFFGRFGTMGLIGLFFSFILYFILGLAVFKIISKDQATSQHPISQTLARLNLCFMFVLTVSMTAAAGSMSKVLLGISPAAGSFFFILLIYLCSLGGKEAFIKANSLLAPLLMGFGVFIGLCLTPNVGSLPKRSPSALPYALFSALLYVSYNILTLSAIMLPLKDKLQTPVSRLTAAFSGSLIMFVLGVCLFSPIVVYYNISQKSPLPILSIIHAKNLPVLFALSVALLFAAVYTTAISNFFGLTESISPKIPRFVLPILSFLCSLAGFSGIISTIYPFFGILGLLNIAFILYNIYNSV